MALAVYPETFYEKGLKEAGDAAKGTRLLVLTGKKGRRAAQVSLVPANDGGTTIPLLLTESSG